MGEKNIKPVNNCQFFSSALERLDFQLLQICPPLKMQTFSHMNSFDVHTWTHNILCKNTTFLTYLHCASFNRNQCPFLHLNISREYLDIYFKFFQESILIPLTWKRFGLPDHWFNEMWVLFLRNFSCIRLQLCLHYEMYRILWNLS